MNATITLERHDGGAIQVAAGSAETSDQRHLVFAVPDTNDSIRVDWPSSADFTDSVEVALRFGTMPAQSTSIKDGDLLVTAPIDAPRFGPDANAILDALRDAFGGFVLAPAPTIGPPATAGKIGKIGKIGRYFKLGKIGKDLIEGDPDSLGDSVAQYAAVGAALGSLLIPNLSGADTGGAVGVLVGVLVSASH